MTERFTAREMEVWRETARGLSNKGIGRKLGIAEATVAQYRGTLYSKLRVKNAVEVTLAAIAHGVTPVPEIKPMPVVLRRGHRAKLRGEHREVGRVRRC